MEDEDDDAEMADYGTDFSDDVDPNFDAKARPQHAGIGNRIPRFRRPGVLPGNGEGIPVSRFGRETGNPLSRFGREPGIGVPIRRAWGFLGLRFLGGLSR